MKVLLTDKINVVAEDILKDGTELCVDNLPTMGEDELSAKIKDYDAIMVRSQTKVTRKIIENSNLKIIGRAGVGVDNIDLDAATEKGIIVVNSPDGNTNAAAEHTIAMMLALSRNIAKACASTLDGNWERSKFTGHEVFGKTLGIIGFGKIGHHVAGVAIALGMKVLVSDPYTTKEIVEGAGCEYVAEREDLWAKCDYITLHTPKNRETIHMINKETLAKMKKGVKIINCARGGIIDEIALKDAIKDGQVSGAAIDVYEAEPDIKSSPLLEVKESVVLTPHLGASTTEAQLNVAIDVANQIKAVLTGGEATSPVNIPTLKPQKVEPVKNYIQLAENTAELAQQISEGNLKLIEINFAGNLAELDTSPLETVVMKGVLASFTVGINYVHAPLIAKQKGIEVITSKSQKACDFIGQITVKIKTDRSETVVSGALLAENITRIVKIDQYQTSIEPERHMLLVPHENKPSMIARVATVIGKAGLNIEHMHVVQKQGENSIMIINTDKETDKNLIEDIKKVDGVKNAIYAKLSA